MVVLALCGGLLAIVSKDPVTAGSVATSGAKRLVSTCPASLPDPITALPHTQAALKAGMPVVIVAFGSSSTQGSMSSAAGHTYPAELQEALNEGLPQAHMAVINRGIGGQDAPEELARLQSDVIAIRPQLVIWQVGSNGAMRGADPDMFRRQVTQGVERLHAAGADVILMDNQRSPAVLAAPEHAVIERELAEVAQATGASLFSRSALMDYWREEGAPYEWFVSADGLHHNDLGYRCVALALAVSIETGLSNRVMASSH
ncbi:MAG: SGNH/GDSL hydrolase family protein [Acetobacteraceae bacterium]|nr:SGNH/GDSL hydrolase family protein [Acetobacteraceae bacterium]